MLLLSSSALAARAERVRQLKALIDAGLYKVDAANLARAILRKGRALRTCGSARSSAGSLDTQVCA